MSNNNYTQNGDYLIPEFTTPENKPIGKYGLLHLRYIKEHKKSFYNDLMLSGKLNKHLSEIDTEAHNFVEEFIKEMAKKQGITEKLKAENQLEWVGRMNNIKNSAEEIIFKTLIYN